MKFSHWFLCIILGGDINRALESPLVSVEEGGTVVLPCNSTAVTGCHLIQSPGWFMPAYVHGNASIRNAFAHNATHCSCELPPADAEAPVDVSFLQGNKTAPLPPAGRVQYTALWTTSLARRPYISTDDHAEVVVGIHQSVHNASISVRLLDGKLLLPWVSVSSGAATTIAFPLALLAPIVEEQVVVMLRRGAGQGGLPLILERRLFLSRVAPPPSTLGSFVQIDYTRKAILVNNVPLVGVGYYDTQSFGLANFSRQARAGINWGLRYLTYGNDTVPWHSDEFIRNYLDWSHSVNMYVLFDLHKEFHALVAEGNSTDLWSNVSSLVHKYRGHPALLGWYVCDDCMNQWLKRQIEKGTPTLDTLYRALKQLDPYHPVIGASDSAAVNAFTTENIFVPGPSLDVVMIENYVDGLEGNAYGGGVAAPGMDGSFNAWPLTWEPVVNCAGNWLVANRTDISDANKSLIMYSMSWLSAVLAKLPMQLHFRLFPFHRHRPIFEDMMLQVGRFANMTKQFQDFLLAPPSGMPEPWLSSEQLRQQCRQCAALWRRASSDFCALVVVVNTENRTATARFQLRGAEQWPTAASALLHREDGSGELRFQGGQLDVALAAFDTHVYTTECASASPHSNRVHVSSKGRMARVHLGEM
eukprot:gnl/TRDRNA2_/TRDRNA2_37003_c0_seq1.p1 gnl/TRDRNA2_/TRDRNA2_37003_c0~~gnl/TRDRNA2_/TRDRNA2_37003_c0_seq1.p1  ORF type:complete len:643 (-),score=59.77 gnl/TRDRNA2_/TRDRNA2_37003_c0_seq1:199-2127(-)